MKHKAKKGKAIISLILGILTIISLVITAFSFSLFTLIIGVLAVIFGAMGIKQSRKMAIAGAIMGFIPIALIIVGAIILFVRGLFYSAS